MIEATVDIRLYNFMADDKLFVDANVWILCFGQIAASDRREAKMAYDAALKKIKNVNCKIFIDAMVVSEFLNARAKLVFNQRYKDDGRFRDFKAFRNSSAFKQEAEVIASDARTMLKIVQCGSFFVPDNIHIIINEYASGKCDFNDLVIVDSCKENGFKLITDDGDFRKKGITVLTANNKLLES